MNRCDEVEQYFGDYVESRLPLDEMAQIDAHLADCEPCRASLREALELWSAVQSLPPEMEPARDLWPAIAARIFSGAQDKQRKKLWLAWRVLAVAASLLVVAGTAVYFARWTPRHGENVELAADTSSSGTVRAEVAKAEQALEQAARDVLADLQRANDGRTHDAQQMLAGNLDITNRAISELKSALKQQPNNPALARKLLAAHEQRLEMLQYMTHMSMSNRYGG